MVNTFKTLILIFLLVMAPAYAEKIDYIIDTDIGGDIDDVLAILVAMEEPYAPLAITTTHIDPLQKAHIAKLLVTQSFFSYIPVYSGIGTDREKSRELFLQQNPLWPPAFGYPRALPGETTWFSQQAKPYADAYPDLFPYLPIPVESAPTYIARIAKSYSPQHKLVIVALGPLHNIAEAIKLDPTITNNIKIYAMGGVYPKGYNWLVSPATTAPVLAKVETVVIASSLIEKYQFYITTDEFVTINKNAKSNLGRTIIQDWKNWYKMNDDHFVKTHLSDPVTLYLALHPEYIKKMEAKKIQFPCLDKEGYLKSEYKGMWYNMPGLEDKLMVVTPVDESNVKFVEEVGHPEVIRNAILAAVNQSI